MKTVHLAPRRRVAVLVCAAAFGCSSATPVADAEPRDGAAIVDAVVDAAEPRDADLAPPDATETRDASDEPEDASVADAGHLHGRVGGHGMLLLGRGDQLFLSHLPAFFEPHTVQLVVAGRFTDAPAGLTIDTSSVVASYLPEPLSLDELRTGALTTLRGSVYRGNHEQGGTLLASGVTFEVSRVVYQAELGGAAPLDQRYLVFGAYAAHLIGASPSFDQLVRVSVDPPLSGDQGVVLSRAHAAPDDPAGRLSAVATFTSSGGDAHQVTPRVELSCLLGPGFGSVCP